MGPDSESRNKKTIINISRNTPVALVVGAGGFLGSFLVDKLLEKEIQVIGIDNFIEGKRENLTEASKDKNFHLLETSSTLVDLEVSRLDYIFLISPNICNTNYLLNLGKEKSARFLLVSSIDLYSKEEQKKGSGWFKETEEGVAKFAQKNKFNARILRLAAVYGPRMDFKSADPMIKLIKRSLSDNTSEISLDFSSRALFVTDAIELMIKCNLAGATARRIFDGAREAPIKIEDVKQILLDPIWHEQRNFKPQELPPWPTPNLEKTQKFLNWHPKEDLVASLRETLSYFKDREIKMEPDVEEVKVDPTNKEWGDDKKEVLQQFKEENTKKEEPKKKNLSKIHFPKGAFISFFLALLISYAILLPAFKLGWGIVTFKNQLSEASQNLKKGDFEKALKSISLSEDGLGEAKIIVDSLESIRRANLFSSQFETADKLINLATLSTSAARNSILGVQYLYQGLKSVTGELTVAPDKYFEQAQIELGRADEQFSKAEALIKEADFKTGLPDVIKSRIDGLESKLKENANMVQNAKAVSLILPQVVAIGGSKTYLVLLQNNNELRPTGGFIGSYAKVNFEGGKLKKLDVQDVYAIDGQLKFHVEPPKEIKQDLDQKDWFLRDSNWEPDFPTSAKQAEWFFNKETGEQVSGVIALDVSALEKLLQVVGPLDLPDYKEKISSDNLFSSAITHAEVSFFPGSQAKKNFLTSISNALFNKLFFVPQNNWPGIVSALGSALEEKHLSIFFDDPKLFSYLISQNWTAMLPRAKNVPKGEYVDFLAPVEANLGANKVNYYLKRSYKLETVIGKEGEIKNRLRINYTNTSPSGTWPAGKYKNRFRIYLPFGTKLTRALWGEKDITSFFESFVDYGRSGFSALLELSPKEQKILILNYEAPTRLTFEKDQVIYKLDVVKQAGTLKDPFEWSLTYPINYKLVSDSDKLAPQELTISTDLSTDKSFEVKFKK